MILPNAIAQGLRGIKSREKFYPKKSNVPFYADTMTIDSFNSLIQAHVCITREQHCYVPEEHDDWVSSDSLYSHYVVVDESNESEGKSKKKTPQEIRLLDSWALKMPVSIVPSEAELAEEIEWRMDNPKIKATLQPEAATIEELQDCYFVAACLDVKTHDVLLGQWVSSGRPLDQEDAVRPEGFSFLKLKAKQQVVNRLAAATTLQKLMSWKAPKFLLDRASGRLLYEEKVLSQIHHAILICRR